MRTEDYRPALLDLIAGDPLHARDRDAIVTAILDAADEWSDTVDPNVVRAMLPRWVNPRVVGAVYASLSIRGVLIPTLHHVTSTDRKGGNYGKLMRLRVLDRARLHELCGAETIRRKRAAGARAARQAAAS